jgi:tetratricopeptide (TPR) repeat protein
LRAVRDKKTGLIRHGLLGFLLMLSALVVPAVGFTLPSAFAQTDDATAQKLESIRKRMESGLALFVSGKVVEAAKTFDEGFAQYPYSAFLFNAGVCYQKLNNVEVALEKFRAYLQADPNAPDIEKVQQRIAALEALRAGPAAPVITDGGAPPPPAPQLDDANQDEMRSLVVIETEPAAAPISVYAPV